jgi:hypothetical protein
MIKHKKDFSSFFSNEKELVKTAGDIKSLQEELKEIKDAGKGISFYSFRKTFRTMLGLKNDLAEYYMGHKLGNDAKTTYIHVNCLENNLFVEEYAQPVIAMLDKFVFYSEEELKKTKAENEKKRKVNTGIVSASIEQGLPIYEASIDYAIMEYKETVKNKDTQSGVSSYFNRI